MNLDMSPQLELIPSQIRADGQEHIIQVNYAVGADDVTRACDRITVDGVEQPERECFPVTGTRLTMQHEGRTIRVVASNDAPLLVVKAFVHEVDNGNDPVGGELERSASIRLLSES